MAIDKLELHKEAIKQFTRIQDKERYSRDQAIEDARFCNVVGAQSETTFDNREDVYRGEINRVAGLVDQVTGGQRENRSSIKYLSTGTSTKNDTANIKTGLARQIENDSDASSVYDQGYDENVTGGYGGWRIITEFEDDGFDQVIKLAAIKSAASSLYYDVDANLYTKADAKHAFLVTGMDPDSFKRDYPDATETDFPRDQFSTAVYNNWFKSDQVLVAEYWWKEPKTKTIVQLTDGRVIDEGEEKSVLDELAAKGITIAKDGKGSEKRRTFDSFTVMMMEMNGAEFLTKPKEFPSKFIPLVPEYGRVSYIEDETYIRGLIRFAKDAQRIYNQETSNQVQIGAEMMDDPIWASAAQVKGYEDQFENYKTERPPIMLYNPDPENPGAPARTGAPSVQQMAIQRIKQAEMDIYATTNMYPPSLGLNVGLESGIALKHQDEKGDRGSYIFVDNHLKSIKYTGQIIEDMIGRVYDTERVITILNLDGTSESVEINKLSFSEVGEKILDEQTGEQVMVNDLRESFSTIVDTSPAYSTQKKESLDQLIELINADPTFMELSTDLVAKNLSVLESDELYKRARKVMIQKGIAEPTEDEVKDLGLDQPQEPNPQETALVDNIEMDTAEKQSRVELNDKKVDELIIKNQNTAIDAYKKLMESLKIKTEAGIPITGEDLETAKDALAMVEIEQNKVKPE